MLGVYDQGAKGSQTHPLLMQALALVVLLAQEEGTHLVL